MMRNLLETCDSAASDGTMTLDQIANANKPSLAVLEKDNVDEGHKADAVIILETEEDSMPSGKKRPRTDEKEEQGASSPALGALGDNAFSAQMSDMGSHQLAVAASDQGRSPLVVAGEMRQQPIQGGKGAAPGGDDSAAFAAARASGSLQRMGAGNPLFGNPAAYREMQLAQLSAMGSMGGLQENAFLQQQLLMAGGHPFAQQAFPFGPQPPYSAHQALSMASLLPEKHRRFPLNSTSLQGKPSANNGAENSLGNTFSEQQAQAALGLGFGRGGFLPDMSGFSSLPALQQMMFAQRSDTDALSQARRQMMFNAGGIPGGIGVQQSLMASSGGRMNNTNEIRGFNSINQQSPAVSLALACDDEHLSEYQILVRKQLVVFEAQPEDVESNTQGRKKQVALGQVGIRCKHCASLPLRQRGRGAVYYPAKLQGVYQAAQNMASSHLCESCQCLDDPLKVELKTLRERRDTASGGKQYWADGARALGLYEADDGLRLNRETAQHNHATTAYQAQQS